MGLYKSRKSVYQRRLEGLRPTTIGPTDPEDSPETKPEPTLVEDKPKPASKMSGLYKKDKIKK